MFVYKGYTAELLGQRYLSSSVVYPLYFELKKKCIWARYGLPPVTSFGADEAPNQSLVFPP